MTTICTWMYTVPKGNKIVHSQTGKHSDTEAVQKIYWRCVFSLFYSSYKQHGIGIRHCLFLNQMPPAYIDGMSTRQLLKQLNIEVIELPHCTVAPDGFSDSWSTQFIIIDIVEWLMANVSSDDAVMVLDSDCLFIKPLDNSFIHQLNDKRCLLYSMRFPESETINGYNLGALKQLHSEISGNSADNYLYTGGEFFCASGLELKKIRPMLRALWMRNLERFQQGKPYFLEEAQLLSSVYSQLSYPHDSANGLIRRIWTDNVRYVDTTAEDFQLTLWHLPSEKRKGFMTFWKNVILKGHDMPDIKTLGVMFRVHRGITCLLFSPVRILRKYYRLLRRLMA